MLIALQHCIGWLSAPMQLHDISSCEIGSGLLCIFRMTCMHYCVKLFNKDKIEFLLLPHSKVSWFCAQTTYVCSPQSLDLANTKDILHHVILVVHIRSRRGVHKLISLTCSSTHLTRNSMVFEDVPVPPALDLSLQGESQSIQIGTCWMISNVKIFILVGWYMASTIFPNARILYVCKF